MAYGGWGPYSLVLTHTTVPTTSAVTARQTRGFLRAGFKLLGTHLALRPCRLPLLRQLLSCGRSHVPRPGPADGCLTESLRQLFSAHAPRISC